MKKIVTKGKTESELKEMLTKKKDGIKKMTLELVSRRAKNTRVVYMERKDVARIKTELRARELLKD